MEIQELYQLYLKHPSIQTDTRKLQKNDMFFALKGPNFNGNKFAQQALADGAAYAVVDEEEYAINEQYILVIDVLQTLQKLAQFHRKQFGIPFIAITGSNGKTTTKELVYAVLKSKYNTYATKGNLNNHIGIPLTILSIPQEAEIAIIEMGANHQKEIESYCAIAMPTHGIITNCGKAHIEGFGGVEGVRKGKGELYDYLEANNGTIFRNTDNDYLVKMSEGVAKQITYGSANANYIGKPLTSGTFLNVVILNSGNEVNIKTQLVGSYNFANVMTAVAVGLHFDIDIDSIKHSIEAYQPDNSRSQLISIGNNQVIMDAYNANPTSMRAAITNFANTDFPKKILWLGAMKEMGPDEAKEHRELIDFIGQYSWEEVILVGDEFKSIDHPYLWFSSSQAAADSIKTKQPEHAAILIKGSRGSRMEVLKEAMS